MCAYKSRTHTKASQQIRLWVVRRRSECASKGPRPLALTKQMWDYWALFSYIYLAALSPTEAWAALPAPESCHNWHICEPWEKRSETKPKCLQMAEILQCKLWILRPICRSTFRKHGYPHPIQRLRSRMSWGHQDINPLLDMTADIRGIIKAKCLPAKTKVQHPQGQTQKDRKSPQAVLAWVYKTQTSQLQMFLKMFEIQACWKLVREPGTPTQKESSQPMNAPRVSVDLILQGAEKKIDFLPGASA